VALRATATSAASGGAAGRQCRVTRSARQDDPGRRAPRGECRQRDDLSTPKRATSGGDLACLCVACARNKLVQSPWRARSPLSFRGDFALSRLRPGNLSRTRSRRPRISAICDKNLVRRELNARQRGVRAASEPAPQRFARFEDELESVAGGAPASTSFAVPRCPRLLLATAR
jgi:hypothetical protein